MEDYMIKNHIIFHLSFYRISVINVNILSNYEKYYYLLFNTFVSLISNFIRIFNMKKLSLLFLSFFIIHIVSSQVKNLKTEYMENPIGLDVENPRFSWQYHSKDRGITQLAYQLEVSIDSTFNKNNWISEKMISDQSLHVVYTGPTLKPSTRYYWRVNIWTNKDNKNSSPSEIAFFETGLLSAGWSGANWIQATNIHKNNTQTAQNNHSAPFMKFDVDFIIKENNASVLFGARNTGNMFMWSINTIDSKPLIRRHIYQGGNPTYTDTPIESLFTVSDLINKEHHLTIEAKDHVIKTYIDNILVDTFIDSNKQLITGLIGFRAFNGEKNEIAIFDNLKVIYEDPENKKTNISEDFNKETTLFKEAELITIAGNQKLKIESKNGNLILLQPSKEEVPRFRKVFELEKEIKSARIYSSALGIYDLFINGKRIGREMPDGSIQYDELKPGWTDYNKTINYQVYDITNYIQKGKNAIGSTVSSGWLNGYVSHGKYGNVELGFIAKMIITYADGTEKIIVTDPSWLSAYDGSIQLGDIYNGETYDARKDSEWNCVDFDDSEWNKTNINNWFNGELTALIGPSIQVRKEMTRVPVSTTIYKGEKDNKINIIAEKKENSPIRLKKGETAIFNLGQNMVGWVNFLVKGKSGTEMKLRFGEILNDTGNPERGDDGPAGSIYTANLRTAKATLRYTLKGEKKAEQYRPSMSFFGFQYCEVTATNDIEILSFVGEVVGTATNESSSFETSNPLINQLYSNIIWGQRGNFLSIPTDCPQRDERLGWTGDTQVFCRTAAYNANVSSFFEKWMGDMRDGQREDGAYPDVAPHSWVGYGQSAWADAGIIVPWTIYLMYDNKGILVDNYDSMEQYMQYLSNQKDAEYKYNGAGTNYGDWLSYEDTDRRYISVCYYAYTAQLMHKISKALSTATSDYFDKKATKYNNLANNIKDEFQTRYINADGSMKQNSQTAYLLALKLNLLPNDNLRNQVINLLVSKIKNNSNQLSTGFVGTAILNQTLSAVGKTNTAYDLLLQRGNPSWLYSVDQGATTIWERWDSYTKEKGFNAVSMNSFNHYSYGAILEWMYSTMGGIDIDEHQPGFKHIIMKPIPDNRIANTSSSNNFDWVKAMHHTSYGDVKCNWKRAENNSFEYEISIPCNTTANVHLILPSDEHEVYEDGKTLKQSAGVISEKRENGKAIIELGSGNYTFKVTKP